MKRRTRFALAAMFDSLIPAELRNVDIASFYPTERNIQKLIVGIEPVQSGSGDPAPDNVRTISGWTGLTVTRMGKNLLPISTRPGGTLYNGVTWTNNNDGSWTADGTATGGNSYIDGATTAFNLGVLPSTEFTASVWVDDTTLASNIYVRIGKGISNTYVTSSARKASWTADGESIYYLSYFVSSGASVDNLRIWLMLEFGPTASSYVPYAGNTYPISWQNEVGTVYGGTLDVVSGVLTVTHSSFLFDGSQTWVASGSVSLRYGISSVAAGDYGNDPNVISNYLPNRNNPPSNVAAFRQSAGDPSSTTNHSIYIINYKLIDESIVDEPSFRTYLTTHPLTVIYKLSTPQTYQLTPTQIATLHPGINNVWCDTGPIIELIS